jgi:Transglutaminase-like superfamily/Coenzyme PQQ synthesis protein D (PqqD)
MLTSRLEQALQRRQSQTDVGSGQQLTIASNVFWVACDGATIILSMDSGKYFGFDNVAAFIWGEIAQHSPQDQIASAMASDYGLEIERARADLDSFIRKLQTNGLVEFAVTCETSPSREEHPQASSNSHAGYVSLPQAGKRSGDVRGLHRFLLFVEAYVLMVRIDVALWRKGFHGLWKRFGSSEKEGGSSLIRDEATVKSICSPVRAAFRWYRPGAACMQRAMTTFWFLRRRGIQAALCLGVRRHPFGSHVWVEFNEKVLDDAQRVRETYQTIARLA